jgi:hypothetical protein
MLILVACSDKSPGEPVLHRLTPESASAWRDTAMVLTGEHLHDEVTVALDDRKQPSVRQRWTIVLGERTIEKVEHPDLQTLGFVVPAGLSPGRYPLLAISPGGRRISLEGGLTVRDGVDGLALTIETAADGGGERITDEELRAGESLELFAVFRTPDGRFVAGDVEVSWSAPGLASALTNATGADTRFRSDTAGQSVVTATHSGGASGSTGTLRVIAGSASALTIEDAAGGRGKRIKKAELSTDETLALYAISRDERGNFVADVAADWSAEAALTAAPLVESSRYELSPSKPGSGRVTARHALADAKTNVITVRSGRAAMLEILPPTATLALGDAPLDFDVEAVDAEGNPTTDTGELTWRVSTGTIAELDADSGTLTPRVSGIGRIAVTSKYGAHAESGPVSVKASVPTRLSFADQPVTLTAGDAPVPLMVTAKDASGSTLDPGTLTWSIASGDLEGLDPQTGILTPTRAGSGVVRVSNERGVWTDSAPITIVAGPIAALHVTPLTALISADSAPLQFTATGSDSFGNTTSDTGTLSWSIGSGPISLIDPATGRLDPKRAGQGTVKATSSLGPVAASSTIIITPGAAAQLALMPQVLSTMVGEPATTFAASGVDADGNATSDLGTLAFTVASGSLATLGASSGTFTPTQVGAGTIRVTSAYGPSALSGAIDVAAYSSQVTLTALRVQGGLWNGARRARFEVDVTNAGSEEALLSALWLGMLRSGVDVSTQYTVYPDYRNASRIPALSTVTLLFFVDVSTSASTGTINVSANLETFHPRLGVAQTSITQQISVAPRSIVPPVIDSLGPSGTGNRVCAPASVTFSASSSSLDIDSILWRFPGGSPSTSAAGAPVVSYGQPGYYAYSLVVTDDDGLSTTATSAVPIFVGQAATSATETYPTGSFVLDSPAVNEAIDMADLPAQVISMSTATSGRLLQCNGAAVPSAGQRHVTMFSDRGRIAQSLDQRSDLPGIQRLLDGGWGAFSDLVLDNDALGLEGDAIIYGEFFHPTLEVVTAAGFVSFRMTNDMIRPRVSATWPNADCGGACMGKGQPWLFRFDEPIDTDPNDPTRLIPGTITVQRLSGGCSSASSGTLLATHVYDRASRTLRVTPTPATGANYTVRVTLSTAITDTAASANSLVTMSRCAGLNTRPVQTSALAPIVTGPVPAAFSPDGDGNGDSTTLVVTPAGQTRWLDIRVRRGPIGIWGHTAITMGSEAVSVTWDGRDWSGRIVPNGFYRFDVTAYNEDGAESPSYTGVVEAASAVHFVNVPPRY